jgi:hypothetical protein
MAALDTRVILAGRGPDVMNALMQGTQAASAANQTMRQNALAQLYRDQGPGIMAGEQGALNALATMSPEAALGVQSTRLGMDATRQNMDIQRQNLEMARRNAAVEAAEFARTLSVEQREAAQTQLANIAGALRSVQGPEQFEQLKAQIQQRFPDLDLAGATFENRDVYLETVEGTLDGVAASAYSLKPERGPDTVVNVGAPGEKFREEIDKGNAAMFLDVADRGPAAGSKIAQIDELDRLLQSSPAGIEAAFKVAAGQYGIQTDGLDNLQAAQAIISRLVPEQRPPGSGPMSDADLELFKQSLPRLINTREGNQQIIATMRGIAEYERELARIANDVVNGVITPIEGRRMMAEVDNPLQAYRANAGPTRVRGVGASTVEIDGAAYTIEAVD